jgi:CheY-like chemotaxis protein
MPVQLGVIVHAAVDAVRHAATAKEISLDVAIDPSLRAVAGDAGRLQQVVWNLLANAVKFVPQGGQIDVSVTQMGSYAEIRVRDTGEGIAPEFMSRLFERFSQQDSSTTRQHGGLGMGLAIVRHLVELHGGTVRAESAGPGRGATFIVRLPQVSTRPASETDEAEARPGALRGVRVLAVEDEPDTRDLIATILRQAGADVAVAGSAEEALGALATAPRPDIVLCDISMPGRDGYQFLREVRRRPGVAAQIPFVALTAHAQEGARQRSLAEGFAVHMAKPVDPGDLVEVVRAVSRG